MRVLLLSLVVLLAGCTDPPVEDPEGETMDSAPNISFQKDATNDRLKIVTADNEADWMDILVSTGCDASLHAGMATLSLTSGQAASSSSRSVTAGDYIQIEEVPCVITLRHEPTNSLYDTWNFS